MQSYFDKVKEFLMELNYSITHEDREEEVFVVSHEEDGISNLVIGCADPILIMEQYLLELKKDDADIYKSLLQKNRDLVHGAFILDDSGKKVIFRDTLQIENLDLNELEASINALSLLLSEYSEELIEFSKN
tara:strand:+ start:70 stop:465 length:396 start_codon:yes stop_codon:yes gene_type:complete